MYSLLVHLPIFSGSGLMYAIDPKAQWSRSIRSMGGFWQGGFPLSGEPAFLFDAFYNWLGAHVQERSAGLTTWEGMIYDMELEYKGIRRRRSLDLMLNAVDIAYQADGEVVEAGYTTQAQSIARYGRREQVLTADNVPSATATGYRDTFLAGQAWPWARPVGVGAPKDARLEIKVGGYVFTASWMFAAAGDGADHDIDHWISALVGTAFGLSSDHGGAVSGAGDCQFLKAGNLASNTLQVPEVLDSDVSPWSVISKLAELGDGSGDPWRVWVDVGRIMHYQPIDLSPRYYLRGGELFDSVAGQMAINPWLMRPGVVRDMSYPRARAEPGSMLTDARDLYAEEIEVSGDGTIGLKTAGFDEAEFLAGQAELLADRLRRDEGTE